MCPDLVRVDGQPALVWRAGAGSRMAAIAVHGGGIGPRSWVLNLQVPIDYARLDPATHLREVAGELGLAGAGVGLLTAARVANAIWAASDGAEVFGTVGLGVPTLAAAPRSEPERAPGTINLVAGVPARLSDSALLNAIATITEAKAQALADVGYDCTGTATDTVTVAVPAGTGADTAAVEDFGGPRSHWGARLARAAYVVVRSAAAEGWLQHRVRPARPLPGWVADVATRRVDESGRMPGAEERLDREGA